MAARHAQRPTDFDLFDPEIQRRIEERIKWAYIHRKHNLIYSNI